MNDFILGSTSPNRKRLLEDAGYNFRVVPSDYEEDMTMDLNQYQLARKLGLGKAQAVALKFPDKLVLGADTIAAHAGHKLGKPKTLEEGTEMLRSMSGKSHEVITGFALIHEQKDILISDYDVAMVYFKKLTQEMIVQSQKNIDVTKFGFGYAIQHGGMILVDHIEGDETTVIGLPMNRLKKELAKLGY